MCAILNSIAMELYTYLEHIGKTEVKNERDESEILSVLWNAYGRYR